MHSPDLSQANIEKIQSLFPYCVTEVYGEDGEIKLAVDFDLLKQELSDSIVEGPQERYHLNWPGKREALLTANAPITKTLRPCRDESINFDSTENLFIEGDNLDALKLLQESYLGKIDLIFIDPPYNTGSDFIYKDNFSVEKSKFLESDGQVDDLNNRLMSNTNADGRFHSSWLSMMFSRLKLAKNLLSENGAIFVAIDDGEVANVRKLLDEIFGRDNLIANFVWQSKDTPGNDSTGVAQTHNHVIAFSKSNSFKPNLLERSDKQIANYKNPDDDPRGVWLATPLTRSEFRERDFYPLVSPDGREVYPPDGTCWRRPKDVIEKLINENRLWWGVKGNANFPMEKKFLSETKDGVVNQSWWPYEFAGSTRNANAEIKKLFDGKKPFDTPKPTQLIKRVIDMCTSKDSVVLDFFAGSSTTAQSVMECNIRDEGKRTFIMVQIPEYCNEKSQAFRDGFENIAQLSRSRIERFFNSINFNDKLTLSNRLGFRTLKVGETNMTDVYYRPDKANQADMFAQVQNIREDRSDEDLLFQVLLDWGVGLTLTISKQQISSKDVFFVNANDTGEGADLIACFASDISNELIKTIAEKQPLRVVFRDDGFATDAVKINVEQIFKQISPITDVKSI